MPSEPTRDIVFDTLGAKVTALTPRLRDRYGIGKGVEGVVITEVVSDGAVARRGLKVGDVISEIGVWPVYSRNDVAKKIKGADGAVLLVYRKADLQWVTVGF